MLSSEVNSAIFFTNIHFSCKRRPYESLVVESHLQSAWGSSLSLFLLPVTLSLIIIWN